MANENCGPFSCRYCRQRTNGSVKLMFVGLAFPGQLEINLDRLQVFWSSGNIGSPVALAGSIQWFNVLGGVQIYELGFISPVENLKPAVAHILFDDTAGTPTASHQQIFLSDLDKGRSGRARTACPRTTNQHRRNNSRQDNGHKHGLALHWVSPV
jgi:hypothetical protein